MKRRSFFGLLGGAAVAGPGMVERAAAQTMADLDVGQYVGVGPVMPPMPAMLDMDTTSTGKSGTISELLSLQSDMRRLLGKSAERRARERRETYVGSLDPDIAALRSVSLAHKVEMQRRRVYERDEERTRHWLQRRIDDLMTGDE